jgi:hypothetical protein
VNISAATHPRITKPEVKKVAQPVHGAVAERSVCGARHQIGLSVPRATPIAQVLPIEGSSDPRHYVYPVRSLRHPMSAQLIVKRI